MRIGYWLIAAGVLSFLFPNWHGSAFEDSNISAGTNQIIGAILFIGGLILIALEKNKQK
jgi:hypothetical protein